MTREGHDVLQSVEGPEALGRQEAGPEQDVLVGEGQQGPAVLVGHDALEGGLGPRGAVDQRQPDQQRRSPPDALEGAEGVAPQLVPLPGLGDEHPGFALLGEVTDVETRRSVRTKIRHFDQLSIAERSAILGAHYDRHGSSLLVALAGSQPAGPAAGRAAGHRRHSSSDAISARRHGLRRGRRSGRAAA